MRLRIGNWDFPRSFTVFAIFFPLVLLTLWQGPLYAWEAGRKVIIAHRGASGYLPEHTLEGVAMAHAWGVDYIEPDVVLTKDGIPVVLHDLTLESTTDVEQIFPDRARADGKWYVLDFTLRELKTLSVHQRTRGSGRTPVFAGRFPLGKSQFRVPSLKEYLELVSGLNQTTGRKVGIYLEIKSPEFHSKEGRDLAKVIITNPDLSAFQKTGVEIIIQCFHAGTLKRLKKEFRTKIPLVQLVDFPNSTEASLDRPGLGAIAQYASGIGPDLHYLFLGRKGQKRPWQQATLVREAHALGLVVHPYTFRLESIPALAKDASDFLRMIFLELGADGLFSDFPDKCLEFLRANGKRQNR